MTVTSDTLPSELRTLADHWLRAGIRLRDVQTDSRTVAALDDYERLGAVATRLVLTLHRFHAQTLARLAVVLRFL